MVISWMKVSAVLAAVVLVGPAVAHAAVIVNPPDTVETLQQLMAGGSLTVGNATYSNFVLGGDLTASAINVDIAQSGAISSITFTPATPWTNNKGSQITFKVNTVVPVSNVGLSFVASGSAGNIASVGETITDVTHSLDYSAQVLTDGAGPFADTLSVSKTLSPATGSLSIVKSIDISGGGTATITSVTNSYATPEPASLSLLSAAAIPLLRRRRRA